MGRTGQAKQAKELKELCEKDPAVREVERGTKHWIVKMHDKTIRPIRIPTTPTDWRSLENCKAELRRAGVWIPHRR